MIQLFQLADEQEIVYVQYLKDGLPKTGFAEINPPDKLDVKGLLAATETVIESLKLQDNKHLDEKTYLNETYQNSVNVNFDGASVMSVLLTNKVKRTT